MSSVQIAKTKDILFYFYSQCQRFHFIHFTLLENRVKKLDNFKRANIGVFAAEAQ